MTIPVIHVPHGGPVIARPKPQPLWDTEYMAPGQMMPLDFFRRCRGEEFAQPDEARRRVDRAWKTPSDTNVVKDRGGCPIFSGSMYGLRHVILYPSTEGILDLREYRAAVERLRQSATFEVKFGDTIYATFPLRDVMANVAAPHGADGLDVPESGEFDPSEAPGLLHRRGVDVQVWLAPSTHATDARLAGADDATAYPICICTKEDFRVRIVPGPQGGEAVAVRAYLVGTHLVGLK